MTKKIKKNNTLSVIILAKNAENLLVDCIESINFADEIIVIDDASVDRTKDIAKSLGAKVIENTAKSFAEKRNVGLRSAQGEWVLYLDTDERISEDLAIEIKKVVQQEEKASGIVAYMLHRQNFYFGNHPWPKIEKLERLFRRTRLKEWFGPLHESPKVDGKVGVLHGYMLHYTHRDLSSMVEKTLAWSEIEAKLRYDAHHPTMTLWRFPRVMLTGFWDSYISQRGYQAGTVGLIESMYQAFSMFVTYAKLWELQHTKTLK